MLSPQQAMRTTPGRLVGLLVGAVVAAPTAINAKSIVDAMRWNFFDMVGYSAGARRAPSRSFWLTRIPLRNPPHGRAPEHGNSMQNAQKLLYKVA
jgi:hypothetical protein